MKTPQQLMDLPAYGMAEKELRRSKRWKFTPQERAEQCFNDLSNSIDSASIHLSDAEHYLTNLEYALEGNT